MNRLDEIFQNEILISVYCGPQPACEVKGVQYPDRITEEQYRLLKACGINAIYGHEDLMNTPTENKAFEALNIAEKVGVAYFVRDVISYEYCSVGANGKWYRDLSEEEKQDLDARYEASLRRYKDKPAFAGVMFIDEPGSDAFPGIRRAKEIFDRVCPGKVFYVNLFPKYVTPYQYQYGWQNKQASYDPKYEVYVHENIDRFGHYFEQFLDIVKPDMVSYDAYPFMSLAEAKNAVHRALWDMPMYVTERCREKKIPYWHYLQCGGRWLNDKNVRITTMGEVNLQISVALAYGARALQLYTGCFPNCCIGSMEHSGVVDEWGNITEQYPLFQYAFMQVKAIQKYLLGTTVKAMIFSGSPYFGMLPPQDVVDAIENRDLGAGCSIYDGTPHRYDTLRCASYGHIEKLTSTSQCFVSCMEKEDKIVYLLVNNSPYAASDVTVTFDEAYGIEYIIRTVTEHAEGKELKLYALPAGENVLIRVSKLQNDSQI